MSNDLEGETAWQFVLQESKGIVGKAFAVEQKVAAQGEKVWKRLPGVKHKDKACQLHLQV